MSEENAKTKESIKMKNRFKLQIKKYWRYTRKWYPFSILIGIVSGIIMAIFTSLIVNLQNWLTIIPIYIKYPLVGGITSLFIYFGFKEVKGAGISYILSHKNTTTPLKTRAIFTKFFTSVMTLGVSAPAGREGPAVTIGSTASAVIGDKFGMTQEDEMHAITIGAAACTAAVFRAPLGGTVFASEVPYKRDLDETVFLPALVASAISLLIYDYLLNLISSIKFLKATPVYLNLGDIQFELSFSSSLHFLLLGIFAGLLGICFSLLFKFFADWVAKYLKVFLLPLIGMVITALIVFFVDTYYMPEGVVLQGTGFGSINTLIENFGSISIQFVLVLLLGKILVTSTCIGFGNSAGIMGPTLVTGAALGFLYSRVFNLENTLAIAMIVVGMSTMHTATTKTPIASMILVLEMVGFPNLVIPIILSNAMAFIFSMDFSLYRGQIESKEVILRRKIQYTDLLETISVKDSMKTIYPTVKQDALLEESFSLLYLHKISSLVVLDENKELSGIISATDFQSGFAKGKMYVHEAMTKDVVTVNEDDALNTVFDKLTDHHIECMPVVDKDNNCKVVGLITFRDIEDSYETALTKLQSRKSYTIEEIEDDL